MNRTLLVAPLVVASVVGAFLVGGGRTTRVAVAADTPTSTSGIVVDGLGKVSGTPDVLRATLGVSVRRDDVSTALRDANALQNSVRAALKKDGVAAKDLQTSDVNISPSYDGKGKRDGYVVSETVTAKLRHLDNAGKAISDAAMAGGNSATVMGVTFALEDNAALLGQARDAAYADAKAKAQRYADLSGRALGKVQLVTETVSPPQELYQYGKALATAGRAGAASPVPIDAGTSQVSVSVTVRWALQ